MPVFVGAEYDLLVVGGGIHGAWVALDATLRGLKVCIVERKDWGSGTSSRSSRLIHGGLRYLEQYRFGLVHEALRERERLLEMAPHRVHPLPFLHPVYGDTPKRRWVPFGLLFYDLLALGSRLPRHKAMPVAEALRHVPSLRRKDLRKVWSFPDAQIPHTERFIWELIEAAVAKGATAHNHTNATLLHEDGRVVGATLESSAGRREVRARIVLDVAGAWSGDLTGGAGARLTKGVHLVCRRLGDMAIATKAADGRTFFVIPWEDQTLVGTTDTDYHGDAANARCTQADATYMREALQLVLDAEPEVRWSYAGVRALVAEPGKPSSVSRKHVLLDDRKTGQAGLWTLAGGKLTTARASAEGTVSAICRALHAGKAGARPTRSFQFTANGSAPRDAISRLPAAEQARLEATYGAWLPRVLAEGPIAALVAGEPGLRCEIGYLVRHEQCASVSDVMLRRTTLGWAPEGRPLLAEAVASEMAALLAWDGPRHSRELDAYRAEARLLSIGPE